RTHPDHLPAWHMVQCSAGNGGLHLILVHRGFPSSPSRTMRGLSRTHLCPMPLLPYPVARAFLFGLDAERAHDLTLAALSRLHATGLGCLYGEEQVQDPVTVAGLRFPN